MWAIIIARQRMHSPFDKGYHMCPLSRMEASDRRRIFRDTAIGVVIEATGWEYNRAGAWLELQVAKGRVQKWMGMSMRHGVIEGPPLYDFADLEQALAPLSKQDLPTRSVPGKLGRPPEFDWPRAIALAVRRLHYGEVSMPKRQRELEEMIIDAFEATHDGKSPKSISDVRRWARAFFPVFKKD
jgi:hypothetical protein